ncbi:MAG: hypothetical protein NTY62_07765 [Euryarchaeota archaeon]|nr:hypothetical protein [Euryarchaeota archaeon]
MVSQGGWWLLAEMADEQVRQLAQADDPNRRKPLSTEGAPAGYSVLSVFNQPLIVVPVFLILFFAFVIGSMYFYEGKEEMGVAILVIAAGALALILGIWKWWMNQS